MEINRKQPRKDTSCVSKRHLRKIYRIESELTCDAFLNTAATLPHNNIRDKCTRNVENASSIYFDTQVNENIVNENDTLREMSEYNDTSVKNVNCDTYKQSIDYTSCLQQSFISEKSMSSLSDDSINITDSTFKHNLATWAVQYRISHIALRALLQRLKQHSCFAKLSLDARSILKTPRKQEIVPPGIYYHFGVLHSIENIIVCKRRY